MNKKLDQHVRRETAAKQKAAKYYDWITKWFNDLAEQQTDDPSNWSLSFEADLDEGMLTIRKIPEGPEDGELHVPIDPDEFDEEAFYEMEKLLTADGRYKVETDYETGFVAVAMLKE